MTACEVCGSHNFTKSCAYCGLSVCNDHRMPENHNCNNIGAATSPRTSHIGQSAGGFTSYLPDVKIIVAVSLVFLFGAVVYSSGGLSAGGSYDESAVKAEVIKEINDERRSEGLAPLEHSDRLESQADQWSATMASEKQLYHGQVQCAPGAENVAQTAWLQRVETESGTTTHSTSESLGEGLAKQWLNSESHRANILSPQFSTTGVGIEKTEVDGVDRVYATQRFCG